VLPTVRAARLTVARGMRLCRGGRGQEKGAARYLPPQSATTTVRGRRSVVPRGNWGGAGLSRRRRHPRVGRRHGGVRIRGELGEAVAAEGERERAITAKKGGETSACGSFAQRPPRLPRIRCDLTRSERGRVSRRGRGRRRGWSAGPRCGEVGPRAVAERLAGGERNRGGEGEGEEDADLRAPGVGEKGESGGG
jgi:hypothetical protein